ncbi:unnamed protein product [Caenorhabditis nigoni]|nr:hypothetical protein B9Z55_004963 [Caenorhabditis nigoni]
MSRRVKRNKRAGPSVEDEDDIWEFLHLNLCSTRAFDDATDELFEKFLRENPEKQWQLEELVEYFNGTMLAALYKCQLLPEKILDLYQKLEIKITEHVERMLEAKCGATIRLDSDRCIHWYQMFAARDSVTETPRRPEIPRAEVPRAEVPRQEMPRPEPPIPHDTCVPEAFEAKMFDHIFSNFTHLTKPLLLSASFWNELIAEEQTAPIQSAKLLIQHFSSKMLPQLYHQNASAHTKLWIYQLMEWPLDPAQRRWFEEKEKMELVMNASGCLKSWKRKEWPVEDVPARSAPAVKNLATWVPRGAAPNVPSTSRSVPAPRPISPGSLPRHRASVKVEELDNDDYEDNDSKHFPQVFSRSGAKTRGVFTLEDKMDGWKYVLKKMKIAVRNGEEPVLPKGLKFWRDYVRETNSRKTADNWCSHFRKYMAPVLHEMPINRKNMLFLYKYIEIKVDDRLRKILERKCDAKVQVANEQVISFKLLNRDEEGDEDQAAAASEGDEDPEEEEPNPADVRIDEESDSGDEVEPIDYDATLPMSDDPHDVTIQPLGDSIDQEHQPEEAPEVSGPEDVVMIPRPEEQRAQDFRTPEPSEAAGNLEADTSRLGSSKRRSIRKSVSIRAKPTCSVRKSSRKRSSSNPERGEAEEDERSVSPVVTRRSLRNSDQRTPKKSTVRIPQVRRICESEAVEEEEPEHEFMAPEFEITDSVIPDSVAPNSVPIDFVEQSGDIFEPSTTPIQPLEDVPSSTGEPKVLDLKKVLPGNEYMEIPTLLQLVQMTLDENCSDDAILQMPEAILKAFHRENWDMDGTPSASAYASAEMVVRENTDGEMRRSLLKNMDSLITKTTANVENRLVLEKRKEAVTKALKKCAEADREVASTSSKK